MPTSEKAIPAPAAGDLIRYRVVADKNDVLDVTATIEGTTTGITFREGSPYYVKDIGITLATKGKVATPEWDGPRLLFDCTERCEVHYRFDLKAAARAYDDRDRAMERAQSIISTPGTWLGRPIGASKEARFSFQLETPPGIRFGFDSERRALPDGKGSAYVGLVEDLDEPPYSVLGPYRSYTVEEGGKGFELDIVGPHPDVGDEGIQHWAREALLNLRTFFPEYPRGRPLLIIDVEPGSGVEGGTTMGNGGRAIVVKAGQATDKDTFDEDWILTHEMFHVSFPGLAYKHHWAEEGMATYLEPIARARRGVYPVDRVWREWITSMGQGQPGDGDQGLDETQSWGRTYWGGALYWFQVDVETRKATQNQKGAPDGFLGVFEHGDISVRWPMTKVLENFQLADGTDAASKVYEAEAHSPVTVDLSKMWKDLGVSLVVPRPKRGEPAVTFDDAAPLAAIRRAMVVGPAR